jgi:hypothetical protein
MAHVGKNYQLWFRRDLSVNRQNVDGFPEAYSGLVSGVTGTWFGSSGSLGGLFINVDGAPGDHRLWKLEHAALLGRLFTCKVTVQGNPNDGIQNCIIRVTEEASGEFVEWLAANSARRFDYFQMDLAVPLMILHQSPPHMTLQGREAATLRAATWHEYNP